MKAVSWFREEKNNHLLFVIKWSVFVKHKSSFHQKMLCAKFGWNRPNGWNWPSGSWEEDENANSLQTEGQQAIIKNLRLHLRWAKKGVGMETNQQILSPFPYPVLTPMWLTMHLQLLKFFSRNTGSNWTKLYHDCA